MSIYVSLYVNLSQIMSIYVRLCRRFVADLSDLGSEPMSKLIVTNCCALSRCSAISLRFLLSRGKTSLEVLFTVRDVSIDPKS